MLKFEDKGIKKDFKDSLNERLEDFKLEYNARYSLIINSDYDYETDILSIQIVLSITDNHEADAELEQIINHVSYKFIKFYEQKIQIINSKNNNN